MRTDTRFKLALTAFVSLTFAVLLLVGAAEEASAGGSRATVPTGPVTKGPMLDGTNTCVGCGRSSVPKGPPLGWCEQHPSAPACRGTRYPCGRGWALGACPPVTRLP
jgi:hypothetical protein